MRAVSPSATQATWRCDVEAQVMGARADLDRAGHARLAEIDHGDGPASVVGHVRVGAAGRDLGDVRTVEASDHASLPKRLAIEHRYLPRRGARHNHARARAAVGGDVLGVVRDRQPPDDSPAPEVDNQEPVLGLGGDEGLDGWGGCGRCWSLFGDGTGAIAATVVALGRWCDPAAAPREHRPELQRHGGGLRPHPAAPRAVQHQPVELRERTRGAARELLRDPRHGLDPRSARRRGRTPTGSRPARSTSSQRPSGDQLDRSHAGAREHLPQRASSRRRRLRGRPVRARASGRRERARRRSRRPVERCVEIRAPPAAYVRARRGESTSRRRPSARPHQLARPRTRRRRPQDAPGVAIAQHHAATRRDVRELERAVGLPRPPRGSDVRHVPWPAGDRRSRRRR